jgi:uncharacterized pyridoxamine 5'-phosphate oxidase family protein
MHLADCLQFARDHPVCSFATTEEIQPRVRSFLLWYADPAGFYFHTVGFKKVDDQVRKNRHVELCFTAPPEFPDPVRMMRVTGECEIIEDPKVISQLFDERLSFLDLGTREAIEPLLVVLRVHSGEIRFWVMENFLMDKESLRIEF